MIVEHSAEDYNPIAAWRRLASFPLLQIKPQIVNLPGTTHKVLESGSGIIAANHPGLFRGPLALLSVLPERRDFYILTNSIVSRLFNLCQSDLAKSTIPLWIWHNLYPTQRLNLGYHLLKFLDYNHGTLGFREEIRKNALSQRIAAEKLVNGENPGGLVLIFPEVGLTDGKIQSGVGEIVQLASGAQDAYLVIAHIAACHGKQATHTISFSNPIKFAEVAGQNPRETTHRINSRFQTFKHNPQT